MNFTDTMLKIHETAVSKGWWELGPSGSKADDLVISSKISLIHSEISEALDEVREGHLDMYVEDGKPEGMVVELGDAVIRIMDLCAALGLDLETAMLAKMEYNTGRSYRHGGKAL